MKEYAIGIDLGTTYSCVGVYRNGSVEIIANDQGNRTTPSKVSFFKKNELSDEKDNKQYFIVGEGAANREFKYPSQSIFGIKRLIGRNYDDKVIQSDLKYWPFEIITSTNNKIKIRVEYNGILKDFSPEEISSMILLKMKYIAEEYLGNINIKDTVITVPAYFNDSQRQATKLAGEIAGLNVLRIINEPTAAAIAYGFNKQENKVLKKQDVKKYYQQDYHILVYDLGGGTFDVSILCINDGLFEVKATGGNTHLGGEDFDLILMNYCIKKFEKKYHQTFIPNHKVIKRLRYACERAKCILSSSIQTTIEIESFYHDIDLSITITRAKFESLLYDILSSTITMITQVLQSIQMNKSIINEIILIGGSTRIPKIQELLTSYFNRDNIKINNDINPDETVAYGASIQAAILSSSLYNVNDNKLSSLLLVDITPLSLGIKMAEDEMNIFIPRNTPIPYQITKLFTTYVDYQQSVEISIYEGERKQVLYNNLLGTFELNNLPLGLIGEIKIEITFILDVNGILTVQAIEQSTKQSTSLLLKNSCRLNKSEIEQMIKEANKYKAYDQEILTHKKLLHQLRQELADITRTINDPKIHINLKEYKLIDNILTFLNQWLTNHSLTVTVDEIQQQLDKLDQYVNPILQKLYKGIGLAAQNMGLYEKKQKLQLAIETSIKQDELLTYNKSNNNPNKRSKLA